MNPTAVQVGRAMVAGMLIGAGIGLGAFNSWALAIGLGVALVIAGLAVAPQPSRSSALPVFPGTGGPAVVPMRITALTRSTIDPTVTQPTLITATVRPPDDTEYEARWLALVASEQFRTLARRPETSAPADALPPRNAGRIPEFDDRPGLRAIGYPVITVVVALALLFGVGSHWQFDPESPLRFVGNDARDATADDGGSMDSRRTRLLAAIADLRPGAEKNILSLTMSGDTDRATVFDPTDGTATNLYFTDGRPRSSAGTTRLRGASTFAATDIAGIDLRALTAAMERDVEAVENRGASFHELVIARPAPGAPVELQATLRADPDRPYPAYEIAARSDGTIADYFDPVDFDTAFRHAREALNQALVPLSAPAVERLEFRGIVDNTPIIGAGAVQNSGGVLVQFRTAERSGEAVVVPGQFPQLAIRAGYGRAQGIRFDSIDPKIFTMVREHAFRRGNIPPYDRRAVDIELSDPPFFEDLPWAIRIEVADEKSASGTYAPDGTFLAGGT